MWLTIFLDTDMAKHRKHNSNISQNHDFSVHGTDYHMTTKLRKI